jgi:hypothetical protein
MADDPLQHRAYADAIVERAASQLRELLERVAKQLDPFPPFPGAMFTHGIEVDPPAGSEQGCVIVMDDGELYELQIGMDEEEIARGGDHVATRHEAPVKLDLEADEYVAFAHRAVLAIVRELEASGGAKS